MFEAIFPSKLIINQTGKRERERVRERERERKRERKFCQKLGSKFAETSGKKVDSENFSRGKNIFTKNGIHIKTFELNSIFYISQKAF